MSDFTVNGAPIESGPQCFVCGHPRKPTLDLCDACRGAFAAPHAEHLVGPETSAHNRKVLAELCRRLFADHRRSP